MTRFVTCFGFAIVVLLASLASAQEPTATPTPAPTPIDGEMIVWSGAKTQAEAEKQLAQFEPYSQALKSFLDVDAVVVESSTVHGLNPGFFIVALGVCGKGEDIVPLHIFQVIEPAVYSKTVHYSAEEASAAPECPAPVEVEGSVNNEPVYWKFSEGVRTVTKSGALAALFFSYDWSEQGDFAREYFEVKGPLLLIGSGRHLLDSQLYEGPSNAARLKETKRGASPSSLAWEMEYADPPCDPSDDRFVSWKQWFWVKAEGTQLQIGKDAAQQLKSGTCGYAEESDAIQGKHHH